MKKGKCKMKKNKLKLITKILAIIVICLVSSLGIYVQKYNKMENIVKDYKLSKDLSGYRQVMFELSDATEVLDEDGHVVGNTDTYDDDTIESNSYKKSENSVNKTENLNKENYEATKKIIEKRLDLMGIEDYTLSLDKETGKMHLQLPEDESTDRVVSNILEIGSFEIKDSEDNTVFITGEQLKKASAMYNTTESGTTVYLHMQLNKEGTSILKDLSTNQYAKIEEEDTTNNETEDEENAEENETTSEETEESEEETQKEITLSVSGNTMVTTSFEDPIVDGTIDLSMNSASTDNDSINETLKTTSTIVTLLESGELPLTYKVTQNQYVETDISSTLIKNTVIVAGAILAILLIFMIIKNKLKGLLGVISYIGFVAMYLLLIRYTNVAISISGAIAMAIVFIVNYAVNMKLLAISKQESKQEYIKIITKLIPLLIISIAFIFMGWAPLSSFGMLLFWGIALMSLYNILITKNIID